MTTTRHIVAGLFVSLDGVAKAPQKWQGPYFHPDTGATIAAELAEADALLLGRRTYEEFAGFWPQAGAEPMADRMNTIPKLVASSTSTGPTGRTPPCWGRTRPPSCTTGSTTARSSP